MILLPFPDYEKSAITFHSVDLVAQLCNIISVLNERHEVTSDVESAIPEECICAWHGYEAQLAWYGITLMHYLPTGDWSVFDELLEWHLRCATSGNQTLARPEWFGRPRVHLSHQSILVRKNPLFYQKAFPGTPADINVSWQ